ncbi:hypothetical protein GGF44_000344 [Coemansia sp. RSA 1694]|nr:hypothetical protein GGF44_000344 [Coemansia sp. RSA 1694]
MGKRILHVTGFGRETRARDLAHAFERYGRLVRCDIPGARRDSKPFAFVEYEDGRDAADAFDRMHDQYVGDSRIAVQWAKRPPARSWRFDGGDDDRSSSRRRSRSRSPRDRSSRARRRSRSPPRDSHRSARASYDDRRRAPSPSRSPPRHARRRDDSAARPAPRDRSPRDRSPRGGARSPRSSRSQSRSRSPRRGDNSSPGSSARPPMDVDALLPADEPAGAAGSDEPRPHHDDDEDEV